MIRETLRGHHQDYDELTIEVLYWAMAHSFGFTPEQVDKMPYDRVIYLLELEKEFKKMEDETLKSSINHGRHGN